MLQDEGLTASAQSWTTVSLEHCRHWARRHPWVNHRRSEHHHPRLALQGEVRWVLALMSRPARSVLSRRSVRRRPWVRHRRSEHHHLSERSAKQVLKVQPAWTEQMVLTALWVQLAQMARWVQLAQMARWVQLARLARLARWVQTVQLAWWVQTAWSEPWGLRRQSADRHQSQLEALTERSERSVSVCEEQLASFHQECCHRSADHHPQEYWWWGK